MTGPAGQCGVVVGFFVLGRCRRSAVTACSRCLRPVCGLHINAGRQCPECASAGQDTYGPGWTDSFRRWFYQRAGSDYQDRDWYDLFDGYDRAAFDPGSAGDPDYDPDERDDFTDS